MDPRVVAYWDTLDPHKCIDFAQQDYVNVELDFVTDLIRLREQSCLLPFIGPYKFAIKPFGATPL